MFEEVEEKSNEISRVPRPRYHHSKEVRKSQKKEWNKRRNDKKRKQKRLQKKTHGGEERASCVPEAVPDVLPQGEAVNESKIKVVGGNETKQQNERQSTPVVCLPQEDNSNTEVIKKRKMADSVDDAGSVFVCPQATTRKDDFKEQKDAIGKETFNSANVETLSRGKKMITLAKRKRSRPDHNRPIFSQPVAAVIERNLKSAAPIKQRETMKPAPAPREINTSLLVKLSDEPIGEGTFGKVFLAEYRGMAAVIKEIKSRDEASKKRERCKREVLHEAAIINCLGDHLNLPFLFGVCTGKELFSLVLQYYGTGGKSLTHHSVVKARMLKKHSTAKVFKDVIDTVDYIHGKGYIHNDIESNNIVIERRASVCDEFHPIIIDFGKTKKITKVKGGNKRQKLNYIAPEVIAGEKETPASDIYSFGKMLS